MSRYERPPFNLKDMDGKNDEARNRLLFDWWCDEGDGPGEGDFERLSDRLSFIRSLSGRPTPIPSRALRQDDPAPLLTEPAPQGFHKVYLLSKPDHVRKALTDKANFSNLPYAALGGASFLLGMDPEPGYDGKDWHARQKKLVKAAFGYYTAAPPESLRALAKLAVEQAAQTSLVRSDFDLALFAEQAALRYMGQLFGYGVQDHGLLEETSKATYRALQYLAIGQHFVTEPGTLPAAQQALGRLITRTSKLMDDYTQLARSPRRYGFEPGRSWPEGVQPWSEIGLSNLGEPLLKQLPKLDSPLSGRDRATVAATLLAGTLGNIQSAACLLIRSLLRSPEAERLAERSKSDDELEAWLLQRMALLPPVPVLPRRTRDKEVDLGGVKIPAGTDCLLLLEGESSCPHVWGDAVMGGVAIHACLGRELSLPLIAALVRHVLKLEGLTPALDPLTGEVRKIERLWGFACVRYPLRYERERVRPQQNLIVSMRVKPPISENVAHLRRFIASAAPRIEHALTEFGGVHFAWFEFSDDDSQLVLRTIYDGQFDSYLQHFALRAGDLFDGLFEYLEAAPPRPVAEHPREFVETLRRFNRVPLAGYLYSAYPSTKAEAIRKWAKL
jgi:cytochrome P450